MVYNPFQLRSDVIRKVNIDHNFNSHMNGHICLIQIVQNKNIADQAELKLLDSHSSIGHKYVFQKEKVKVFEKQKT